MGNWLGFQYSWIFNPLTTITNSYASELKIKNCQPKNTYFGSYFIMGGHKFERSNPETFLFGDLIDIKYIGNQPMLYPYKTPMWFEPVRTLKSLIHIRKDTLKFVRINVSEPPKYNLQFIFDSDVKLSITMYYYAKEINQHGKIIYALVDESMRSKIFEYEAGCNQFFDQPMNVIEPVQLQNCHKSSLLKQKLGENNLFKPKNSLIYQGSLSATKISRAASAFLHHKFDQINSFLINQPIDSSSDISTQQTANLKQTSKSNTAQVTSDIHQHTTTFLSNNITTDRENNEDLYFSQYYRTEDGPFNANVNIPPSESSPSPKEECFIYPIVIFCNTRESDIAKQTHITLASIETSQDGSTGGFIIKPLKQKLISDGLSYLIQEVYGIENKNRRNFSTEDDKSGVKSQEDTTNLPTVPEISSNEATFLQSDSENMSYKTPSHALPDQSHITPESAPTQLSPVKILKAKIVYENGPSGYSSQESAAKCCTEEYDEEDTEFILCQSECLVCLTQLRNTVLLPCRHLCLCHGCATVLRYQDGNCPVCRVPFKALLLIEAMRRRRNTSSLLKGDGKIDKSTNTNLTGTSKRYIKDFTEISRKDRRDKDADKNCAHQESTPFTFNKSNLDDVNDASNYNLMPNNDHLYDTIAETTEHNYEKNGGLLNEDRTRFTLAAKFCDTINNGDDDDDVDRASTNTKMNIITQDNTEEDKLSNFYHTQNDNLTLTINKEPENSDPNAVVNLTKDVMETSAFDDNSKKVVRINIEKLEALIKSRILSYPAPGTRNEPPDEAPNVRKQLTPQLLNMKEGKCLTHEVSAITPRGFEAVPLIVALNGPLPKRVDAAPYILSSSPPPPPPMTTIKRVQEHVITGNERTKGEGGIPTNSSPSSETSPPQRSRRARFHGLLSTTSPVNCSSVSTGRKNTDHAIETRRRNSCYLVKKAAFGDVLRGGNSSWKSRTLSGRFLTLGAEAEEAARTRDYESYETTLIAGVAEVGENMGESHVYENIEEDDPQFLPHPRSPSAVNSTRYPVVDNKKVDPLRNNEGYQNTASTKNDLSTFPKVAQSDDILVNEIIQPLVDEVYYDTHDHFSAAAASAGVSPGKKKWSVKLGRRLSGNQIGHPQKYEDNLTPLLSLRSSPPPSTPKDVPMRRFNSLTYPLCAYTPLSTSSARLFNQTNRAVSSQGCFLQDKNRRLILPKSRLQQQQHSVLSPLNQRRNDTKMVVAPVGIESFYDFSCTSNTSDSSSSTSSSLSNLALCDDDRNFPKKELQ